MAVCRTAHDDQQLKQESVNTAALVIIAAFGVNCFSSLQQSICESIIRDMLSKIAILNWIVVVLFFVAATAATQKTAGAETYAVRVVRDVPYL